MPDEPRKPEPTDPSDMTEVMSLEIVLGPEAVESSISQPGPVPPPDAPRPDPALIGLGDGSPDATTVGGLADVRSTGPSSGETGSADQEDKSDEGQTAGPAKPSSPRGSQKFQDFLRKLAMSVVEAASFYWRERSSILKAFPIFLHGSEASEPLAFEYVFDRERSHPALKFEDDEFRVSLPALCVVCGNMNETIQKKIRRDVLDILAPAWLPVLGLAIGGAISIFFWSKWFIPIGLLVGLWCGCAARRNVTVRLKYRVCAGHQSVTHLPRTWVCGRRLVVGFGSQSVPERLKKPERRETAAKAAEPRNDSLLAVPIPRPVGDQEEIALTEVVKPSEIHFDAAPMLESKSSPAPALGTGFAEEPVIDIPSRQAADQSISNQADATFQLEESDNDSRSGSPQ